jgi:hypothetical protein
MGIARSMAAAEMGLRKRLKRVRFMKKAVPE